MKTEAATVHLLCNNHRLQLGNKLLKYRRIIKICLLGVWCCAWHVYELISAGVAALMFRHSRLLIIVLNILSHAIGRMEHCIQHVNELDHFTGSNIYIMYKILSWSDTWLTNRMRDIRWNQLCAGIHNYTIRFGLIELKNIFLEKTARCSCQNRDERETKRTHMKWSNANNRSGSTLIVDPFESIEIKWFVLVNSFQFSNKEHVICTMINKRDHHFLPLVPWTAESIKQKLAYTRGTYCTKWKRIWENASTRNMHLCPPPSPPLRITPAWHINVRRCAVLAAAITFTLTTYHSNTNGIYAAYHRYTYTRSRGAKKWKIGKSMGIL